MPDNELDELLTGARLTAKAAAEMLGLPPSVVVVWRHTPPKKHVDAIARYNEAVARLRELIEEKAKPAPPADPAEVRELIARAEVKPRVIAKFLNVSTQTVYNWRLGHFVPPPEVVERLRAWIGSEEWRNTCQYEAEHVPHRGRPFGSPYVNRKKRAAEFYKWHAARLGKLHHERRLEREKRGIISRQSACRKNFEWIAAAEREARPHYKRAFSLNTLYCQSKKNPETGMYEWHSTCSGKTYTFK